MATSLKRTMDARFLNQVANHDEVRPTLGGIGPLDLTGLIENPENVALVNGKGGFVVVRHEPGTYEVHTLFLPEGRGPHLPALIAEGLRFMFTATGCVEVQTKVPANNPAAAKLAEAVGFSPLFVRQGAWGDESGETCDVSYRSLTFDAWKARDEVIAAQGRWFHDQLEAAKAEAGSEQPTHPDDEAHDRAVGAALLMIRAGNPAKGVWLYNRWARLAGYAPIQMLSDVPLVIDVVDAVVGWSDGGMEVLKCR